MNERNIAFIDGQNLHMGTEWNIDHKKFRKYLTDKYHVDHAYYFLGCIDEDLNDLYSALQKSGFIIAFREHTSSMKAHKKGNVDTDIVFHMMKSLIDDSDDFDKIILVSGDGDYKKIVDYLISKKKFEKILFPNKKFASSLYKKLGSEFFDYLENNKSKLIYRQKEKGS